MIKIKNKTKEFIKVFEICKNFNEEANLVFSPAGISIQAIAISNISLCNFIINKSLFEEYDVSTVSTYGLNLAQFVKILKKVGKSEMILEILEEGMCIKNEKENYVLTFINPNIEPRAFPVREYKSKWELNTEDFFNKITEVKELSEIIGLEGSDKLKIKIKGMNVKGHSILDGTMLLRGNDFCFYDTTYLIAIKELGAIASSITLNFATETPCYITAETLDIKFEWMLAPRIEDDE